MRCSLLALAAWLCAASLLSAQATTRTTTPSRRDTAKPAVVVVEPNDFRRPLANPEDNLAPKYNERTVRFTGVVVRQGEDAKEKRRWIELQATLPEAITTIARPEPPVKLKPGAIAPRPKVKLQTLTVRVYPQFDDPRFRNPTGQLEVTAEGRGIISAGIWTLTINDATLTAVRQATTVPAKDAPLRR